MILRVKIRSESRHAELAVSVAGSVAIFLIKTYEKNLSQTKSVKFLHSP